MLRKRFGAFLIDMLLVCLIAVTLGNLNYLNPYIEKYELATEEYKDAYYEYQSNILGSGSSIIDNIENLNEYVEEAIMPKLKKVEKYYIFYGMWYLITYFLYFCIFTYYNDGQTLGKKLFKIKVVNKGENKVSFNRLIRRSLFNGTSLYYGINIILLLRLLSNLIIDTNIFVYIYYILEMISIIIEVSLVITLFVSKGKKLTNDYIAQTEVIEVK